MPSTRHDRPVTPALDPCPSARGQSQGQALPSEPTSQPAGAEKPVPRRPQCPPDGL